MKARPILVIGAGNSGLAMAAHLALAGHQVRLWNRSQSTIEFIRNRREILLEGVISGAAQLESITNDIESALQGVSLVLVTVPASGHHDVAQAMAPYLTQDHIVLLNPGRTFGALEVARTVEQQIGKCNATIAEAQTILYACRKLEPGRVVVYGLKNTVPVAALEPARTRHVLANLPSCLAGFVPARNCLETSFNNVGMLLHCAPMLFNIGWVESEKSLFQYYYDGVSPTIARFIELLDLERITVGQALGVNVLPIGQWLETAYQTSGNSLYERLQANAAYAKIDAPQTLRHRYIFEDIPTGLVPLEAVGVTLGIPVVRTSMLIELACALLDHDFRLHGRNANKLCIHDKNDVVAMVKLLAQP